MKKKIGILGGGQLARMLALKAHEMGLEPHVLSRSKSDPSAQVTSFWTQGSLDSLSDLTSFLKKIDLAVFENEFIDIPILKQALKKTKTPAAPRPQILENLQDRRLQKNLLKKHHIPQADFKLIHSYEELLSAFHFFGKKMVLKKRRFGYDGKGVFILKNLNDCMKMKTFFRKENSLFIGESFVPFRRELAVVLAVHKKSKPIALPLMETFQENFQCLWAKGPVRSASAQKLIMQLKTFVQKIQYEGVIAFELFESSKGLWVNELAPRVHNSGHYSLNALSQDQFTLHLKACLQQPLTEPRLLSSGFAMMNLLGKTEADCKWKKQKDVFLHQYGKKEKRKGRKMGHLNACAASSKKALNLLFKAVKSFS